MLRNVSYNNSIIKSEINGKLSYVITDSGKDLKKIILKKIFKKYNLKNSARLKENMQISVILDIPDILIL